MEQQNRTIKPPFCNTCPFFSHRYVPSEGRDDAMITLIGEAPGAEEDRVGRPFVGGAGKLLDKLLFGAGISRSDCRIINVLKCRPPDNDISTPAAKKAIRMCSGIFIEELNRLNSRVIIPMGNTALAAIGYGYKINEVRGTYFDFRGTPVVPTLHPAALMRQFEDWIVVQSDLKKALAVAKIGKIPKLKESFNVKPTIEEVEDYCRDICTRADASPFPLPIGYDLETFETDHELRTPIKLVGISRDGETSMCIPFITQSGNLYWDTKTKGARAMGAIYNVLAHPNILKLGQNLLFDFRISMNHGLKIVGPVFDTMIGHFLVYHPIGHGLQVIASLYTDYPPWKTLKGLDDEEYRKYNCRDTTVLHHIMPPLLDDINDNGVRWIFDRVMDVLVPYCQMTLNGLPIDAKEQTKVAKQLTEDVKAMTKELQSISGALALNPNSTKQLSELLFKQMKLKSDVKTKGGKSGKQTLSVAKDVLNRLAIRYPENEFLVKLLEYNSLEQLRSTYANPDVFPDGRIHAHFKLAVITGRPSTVNPNILNLPSKKRGDPQQYIKAMYVAPPGRVFIEADWSQAELVVFAEISHDEEWIACFARGDDVHKLNGIALIGPDYDDSKYRIFVKNFIYGFIYGSEGSEIEKVAPRELIQKLSVTRMIGNYKLRHPNMFAYRERLQEQIATEHRITNPFGRPRYFVGEVSKKNLREAYNFPIQSTIADMMNVKIARFNRELNIAEDKLLMPLYDAVYFEVDESKLSLIVPTIKAIMEEPVTAPNGMTFKLDVDVKTGKAFNTLEK